MRILASLAALAVTGIIMAHIVVSLGDSDPNALAPHSDTCFHIASDASYITGGDTTASDLHHTMVERHGIDY